MSEGPTRGQGRTDGERLQKYLSRAGIASRRAAEALIVQGRVQVNNRTVTELGTRVLAGADLVTVDGTLAELPEVQSYAILYKPPGVVTTLSDPQGRATIRDLLRGLSRRVFPVGRLDYDAEGALIVTDDGELANRLTHPRFGIERIYLAKVKGAPETEALDRLRGGVQLEDGPAQPRSVDVFHPAERNTWLKLVVTEGRPHLIKRLCAAVGHPVLRLFRPAHAGISVRGMQPGQWRALTPVEVERLWQVAAGKPGPVVELHLPARRHGRSGGGGGGEEDEGEGEEMLPRPRPSLPAKPSSLQGKRPGSHASRPPGPRAGPRPKGTRAGPPEGKGPRAGPPRGKGPRAGTTKSRPDGARRR